MKRLGVAVAFVVCAFAITLKAQTVRADSSACLGYWSSSFPVQRADGRPVYVERGAIATLGHQILALGSPTLFWLGRNHIAPPDALTDTAAIRWSFTRAGALIDSGGTAAGVPPIDTLHRRGTPRLVGQDDHTAAIAWATADSVSSSPGENDNRIELTSFDGRRWTTPKTIIAAPHVRLDPAMAIRGGAPLSPSVVAVTARDSVGIFVRVARRIGERWITSDWRNDVFGLPTAVATQWADGSVTLLVMGSHNRQGPGVFSIRGEPNSTGYTWAQTQLVDSIRSGYQPFSTARLGGDSLVIVWHASRVRGETAMLNTALSVDRGESWKLTAPLLTSSVDGVRLIVDGNGELHAFYRGAPEDLAQVLNSPGLIMHSEWRSGRWTPPTAVSTEESFTSPEVGVSSGRGLTVMWATAEFVPGGILPKSFVRMWTPGCKPQR